MKDEVQEHTGDDNQLRINFSEAKALVRHLWKAVKLHEQHHNKILPIKIVQWNCRSLRNKLPDIQQRNQNIDVIILSET
jgi:hypothetical protein